MSFKPKWILLGAGLYLVFLVAKLPASQLLRIVSLPPSVEVGALQGTLWQGQTRFLSYQGIPVENVSWSLSPWQLLLANASLTLDAGNTRDSQQISLQGALNISLFNAAHVGAEQLQIYLPSDILLANLPLPVPVNTGGRFRITIDTLAFDQQCEVLEGKGQWLNASFEGLGPSLALGNFDATLTCDQGVTVVSIAEPNIFGLSADARIPADLNISVSGRFKPDASLPADVHDAAKFFGQRDAQGYYVIDF